METRSIQSMRKLNVDDFFGLLMFSQEYILVNVYCLQDHLCERGSGHLHFICDNGVNGNLLAALCVAGMTPPLPNYHT